MKKILTGIGAVLVFLGLTSIFIVDETEQVVVLQFGKPVRIITEPGLHIKVPFPFRKKMFLITVSWNTILHRKKY
jgi:regulator of protease activity HflC (stomatin/prohibitin superfamily)